MNGRILIFSRALPMHRLGGMEQMAWDLACALACLGARVTVVTTSIAGVADTFEKDGVEVVALAGTRPGRYSAAWWRASRRFLAAQSALEVAAVLSVSAAGFGLIRLKPDFKTTRFVMQAHGTSWDEIRSKWRGGDWRARLSSLRNFFWLPKDLLAYRQFDMVVAAGDAVLQSLERPPISLVLPANKRRLIRNGVNTALFAPNATVASELRARLGVPPDAPIIISASRLHAQKGGAAGLRAFANYAAGVPAAHYWVVGEGPECDNLIALAASLRVADRVAFLGRLDRPALAQHLAAADVFLFLGSRIEAGLPLNVLEALASGLPVVLSAHLATGATGLFPTNPNDPPAVATQLVHAVELRGQNQRLPDEFKLKNCAQDYLNLLIGDG